VEDNVMITSDRKPAVPRSALLSCLAFLLAAPGWAAGQSPYSGIVAFGTSLSDPGNAFVLQGDAGTPPDFMLNPLLIPSAPYAKGGHHFSNGPTWVEQLGRSVGLGGSVHAALSTPDPEVTNFAVGAARAYNDGVNFNLTRQVDEFLLRSGGVASSQALYVIEMGSNDIRDSFQVYAGGGNGGPILEAALTSIGANIQRLYAAGARNFLVWTAPNVALTPAIRSLGPAAGGLATMLTQAFNGGLSQVMAQLAFALPGISLERLDAYELLLEIVLDPAAFALTDVKSACVTPGVAPFTCQDADSFLFWDGIHPTRAGHAILARQAAIVLQ
jgi:phospholipase/lecithinase/hemolysin